MRHELPAAAGRAAAPAAKVMFYAFAKTDVASAASAACCRWAGYRSGDALPCSVDLLSKLSGGKTVLHEVFFYLSIGRCDFCLIVCSPPPPPRPPLVPWHLQVTYAMDTGNNTALTAPQLAFQLRFPGLAVTGGGDAWNLSFVSNGTAAKYNNVLSA